MGLDIDSLDSVDNRVDTHMPLDALLLILYSIHVLTLFVNRFLTVYSVEASPSLYTV